MSKLPSQAILELETDNKSEDNDNDIIRSYFMKTYANILSTQSSFKALNADVDRIIITFILSFYFLFIFLEEVDWFILSFLDQSETYLDDNINFSSHRY